MHEDIVWLGPAPAMEDCAQIGSPGYARDAKTECRASIEAIRKVCGHEPEGARLTIKGQPHDFGTYYECAVVFDGNNHAAAEYASKCDEQAPGTWEEAGRWPRSCGEGIAHENVHRHPHPAGLHGDRPRPGPSRRELHAESAV